MLGQRRWVLERDVVKVDLIFKLDAESAFDVWRVPDFRLALNDFENEGSQCLGSDKALNVGQGRNQADKTSDESDQHGEHILLIVCFTSLAINSLVLDQDRSDEKRIGVETENSCLHDAHHEAVGKGELLGDLLSALRILRELSHFTIFTTEASHDFDSC